MGWLARAAVISTTLAVGCASIAGISDEPEAADAQTQGADVGSSGTSGGSGTSGAPAGSDARPPDSPDAAAGDGAVAPDAPACTRKEDGVACGSNGECCVGGCNEARVCGSCKGSFQGCDPGADAPCCHGMFCSFATAFPTCQACVLPTGTPRSQVVGGGAKSCCSRMVGGDGKCL